MRILFLSKNLHYNGGGERMLVNLANALSPYHDITILTFDDSQEKLLYGLGSDIKVLEAKIQKRKINFFTKLDYRKYIYQNKKSIDEFDIVIGVGIICNIILANMADQISAKTIAWEHSCYRGVPFYQKVLRKLWFEKLDQVICLTNEDYDKYVKINHNTKVLYNFTEMKYRKPHNESKTFLFVGRLSEEKGISYLCKIIKDFCMKNGDWKFKIIGQGKKESLVKECIKKNNLFDRVQVESVNENIQYEYENSECLIMTSVAEGLPMVLIEAQTCGIPAISFNTITGPSEIILDGVSGYIVDRFDTESFVNKMIQFCSDEELRQSFSHQCLSALARFDKEHIVGQWRELIDSIVRL